MAAVLNPFRSWLSAEGRAAREVKGSDMNMAEESHAVIAIPKHTQESLPADLNLDRETLQDQSDIGAGEENQEPDEEYTEVIEEEARDEGKFVPRRSSKRKRQNKRAFQKNARAKISISESEGSVASDGSSSEEEAPWEVEDDSGEETEQAVADNSNCM